MPYSTSLHSGSGARAAVEMLWEQVYGGFSPARYDWLYVDNPAGEATVCLLRDDDSGSIVGSTALLLRKLCTGGTTLRAGIAADLMVHHRHRSLGPSVILQKGMLACLPEAGIGVVYGFPNAKSIPMTRRIGYRQVAQRMSLVLPLRSEPFLRQRIPQGTARKAAAMPIDVALWLRPRLYTPVPAFGREHFVATSFDHAFDDIWSRIKSGYALIGEKTAAFLNWRYRDSPREEYAVFGLRARNRQALDGYVVYSQSDGRMHMADFAWDPARISLEELLIRFARWSGSNGAQAVSIALTASPGIMRRFTRAGFHLREAIDPFSVYTPAGEPIGIETGTGHADWYMVPGDNDA